jgi:transcription initiation factor TFIIIB Brf1 subunit/transcription initiation factor TFIIB
MEEDNEKPKCVKCGSSQIYLRLKRNQRYCRTCGYVQDLKNKINNEEYGE